MGERNLVEVRKEKCLRVNNVHKDMEDYKYIM